MQEKKCGRTRGADDHRFCCGIREEERAQPNEQTHIDKHACNNGPVVETLLPVPAYGLVLMTHRRARAAGTCFGLIPGQEWRNAMPLRKRAGSKIARTRKIARWVLRSG